MPTPRTAYESMSTPLGFTYPLPPGRTPLNPAYSYSLPASSCKSSASSLQLPRLQCHPRGLKAGHIEAVRVWEVPYAEICGTAIG